VTALSADGLSQALGTPRLVGIHCWAAWNSFDYEFARELMPLVQRFATVMDFYAMDVEQSSNSKLLASWGIMNLPAFVIIRNRVPTQTFCMQSETVLGLRDRIVEWLKAFST
jgi:hypothetical protein